MPTPKSVNWFNLCLGFDKFTNKLRIKFNQVIDKNIVKNTTVNTNNSSNNIKDISNNNEQLPREKRKSNNLYRSKKTKDKYLETFFDTIEKQLFRAKVYQTCS